MTRPSAAGGYPGGRLGNLTLPDAFHVRQASNARSTSVVQCERHRLRPAHPGARDGAALSPRKRLNQAVNIAVKLISNASRSIAAPMLVFAIWLAAASAQPQASATIHGTVQDAAGTPVSGASVRLERDGAPPAEIVTSADGSFAFPAITPGFYTCLLYTSPSPRD